MLHWLHRVAYRTPHRNCIELSWRYRGFVCVCVCVCELYYRFHRCSGFNIHNTYIILICLRINNFIWIAPTENPFWNDGMKIWPRNKRYYNIIQWYWWLWWCYCCCCFCSSNFFHLFLLFLIWRDRVLFLDWAVAHVRPHVIYFPEWRLIEMQRFSHQIYQMSFLWKMTLFVSSLINWIPWKTG